MASAATKLGEIHADESYPLPVFQDRTGLARKSIATAKRNGLKVTKVGRRSYVLGSDWHMYLRQRASAK